MSNVVTNNKLKYWLALYHVPKFGPRSFAKLLGQIEDVEQIFQLKSNGLRSLGLTERVIQHIQNPDWQAVEEDFDWLAKSDQNHILHLENPAYPPLLKQLPDPPPMLFIKGQPSVINTPQLAMVGSRNPSPTGRELAFNFAKVLSEKGLTITSGLALGVDGAAHQGVIAGGGTTIAVCGTGLNQIYPSQHKKLAEQIMQRGALVSEFPLNSRPSAGNFPRRNRIISGLSYGVLVVEAAIQSGSLITARCATEQGREVFAIPGSIHNPLAKGCHALIRQGAKLIETCDDIFEEMLGFLKSLDLPDAESENPRHFRDTLGSSRGGNGSIFSNDNNKKLDQFLDKDYTHLIEHIGFEPTSVDTLIGRTQFSASNVSSMLLVLELQGLIASTPGGYIRMQNED